ncbi:hypothetical protein OX284_007745 [Flavobacterium sp. SUN046]|uniref:hypothetical protein n=1 Tax=Flavobacterium sp. SUN046 TaxID=3002440 RepID=UPI002DBCF5B7|nr:hypothetical protein [Flavobacterium sp. SUN046]MEC4049320.1 hypothetical protein [Flavobacterium sp. SUN046]
MRNTILILICLFSTISFCQENKVYRIYLKDNTTIDIINPKRVSENVNYETLDGNSGSIENSKYYTIRLISKKQSENYTPIKFTYCELIGIDNRKLFSIKSNLNVRVDYGDNADDFESGYIIDEKNGRAITFSSMVEAMNYMGQNGWEFVQAYTVSEPSGGQVYRWLLKRAIK